MSFVSSTLKSFEKWRSPLFGATGNFNHQILPYGNNVVYLSFDIYNIIMASWQAFYYTKARKGKV
jgi:hypothetical protein